MRRRTLMLTAAGLMLSAGAAPRASAQGKTIVVGGKDFTESLLIASITAQLLKAHGYSVTERTGMGSTLLREAMVHGQVDVYWEYVGTGLIVYNKIDKRMSVQQSYDTVKAMDAKKGIVWLDPSRANDTWALAMNKDEAEKLHITTISDLAKAINGGQHLTLATGTEFAYRPDGLKPLEEVYGFHFPRSDLKFMAIGLTYQALRDHQVDVAMVYSTDGRIPAFNLLVLKDDKEFFPSYAMTPIVRAATLAANPGLADLLNGLSAKLDDQVMAFLNAQVDVDKQSVQPVAAEFLRKNGML